jgi:hypothetical protein
VQSTLPTIYKMGDGYSKKKGRQAERKEEKEK